MYRCSNFRYFYDLEFSADQSTRLDHDAAGLDGPCMFLGATFVAGITPFFAANLGSRLTNSRQRCHRALTHAMGSTVIFRVALA